MRRFGALLAALAAALIMVLTAQPAHADGEDWYYSRYDQHVSLATNGVATVVLDATLEFGSDPGHGPVLNFITRQKMADGRFRLLDTDIVSVTSSTGANTNIATESSSNTLTLRVGRQGTTFTGAQQYTITYTIKGLVTPDQAQSHLDEFNWTNIGDAGNTPHRNVTVTVSGPAAPTDGACWQGWNFDVACQTTRTADSVVLHTDSLERGEPMQSVAGYPVGTFVGAEPEYYTPKTLNDLFDTNPLTLGGAALMGVAGGAGAIALGRRGRDRVYAGVAPGNVPADQATAATILRSSSDPVAVRFTPPVGIRPAEGDYLRTQRTRTEQVSATMVDLAVRGYLTIEQNQPGEFTFRRTGRPTKGDGSDLNNFERAFMGGLFKSRQEVTTQRLKSGKHGPVAEKMKTRLADRALKHFGWFNRSPLMGWFLGISVGIGIILVGVAATLALGLSSGLGWLGIGIIIVGVVALTQVGRFSHRTPQGSAALAQVQGFEKYLATAEADQLKWEEGQDIYSAYLPWAIAFGSAERWTKLFASLAEQGRYDFEPTWYYSPYHGFWYGSGWAGSLDTFTQSIQDSIQRSEFTATSGSSSASHGFSGFSGGGGFGGGGSGAW